MAAERSAKKRGGKRAGRPSKSVQPDYEVAMRIARMVSELPGHPFGWALSDVAEYLRVSDRTVRRYVKVLGQEFTDDNGGPVYGIEKRGDELKVVKRLPAREDLPQSVYHLISLYLSFELFRLLGENVVAFSVEDLMKSAEKKLTSFQRELLANMPRKFYAAAWAPKDYSGQVDLLEDAIKALVYQNVITMTYKKANGETKNYTVFPYTLLYHKGGFYLVGKSTRRRDPVYFNLERIQSLAVTPDKFDYPRDYHPKKLLDGAFGIFAGPARTFRLKFSPQLKDYLLSRRWHRSQKFRVQKDGSVLLTLKVTDSEEVRSWIRSFGRMVKEIK